MLVVKVRIHFMTKVTSVLRQIMKMEQMLMKGLNEDIKTGNLRQIYLLCGEEDYLKKQYKEKLRNAFLDKEDTMNYNYFSGKNISLDEVIGMADTMPFFAERRLIVIQDSGLFKTSNELGDYLKRLPSTTCMVFVESEIDKRNKLYKAVKDKGRIVELGRQNANTLTTWVLSKLKAEKKNITKDAMELFFLRTGDDMEHIEKELEKLICFCMEKDVIERQDVEQICTITVTNKIFDMVTYIAEHKKEKALALYYDLLSLKEPPMRILFLIARQFNLLLQVKELINLGKGQAEIAGKISLAPFIAKKYMTQSQGFSTEQLRSAVENCVDVEEAVKQGRMNDKIGVEMLIVKYSEDVKRG